MVIRRVRSSLVVKQVRCRFDSEPRGVVPEYFRAGLAVDERSPEVYTSACMICHTYVLSAPTLDRRVSDWFYYTALNGFPGSLNLDTQSWYLRVGFVGSLTTDSRSQVKRS